MRRPTDTTLVRRVRLGQPVLPDSEVQDKSEPEPEADTALVAVLLYLGWVLCFLASASKAILLGDIRNCTTGVREWEKRLCDPDYDHWAKVSQERMGQPTNYYQ
jgi:hypothetical protein